MKMKLEELKKRIEAGGKVDLSAFKNFLLEDEGQLLEFIFELSYEYKYQFEDFQHILDFHSTDITAKIKDNSQNINTKEDIRKVFEDNFYDYSFQWELLDKFLETIEK